MGGRWHAPLIVMTVIALLFGIHMVMAIGGADMPLVVSMLNSYSGWAAAATGFMLSNDLLIVTGALVGSSGAILSYIMCRAMNRQFLSVIAGGFGTEGSAKPAAGAQPAGEVNPINATETAELLREAKNVIIVPGYGMAVAQAQHRVRELYDQLTNRGVKVKFVVHPVARRMPGTMGLREDPSLVRSKGVMIDWPGTKTKDVYLGRIGHWSQGGLQIRDLMCLFAELPAPLSVPLLGNDYLSQFLMTIDYPNHEILFVPYEDASFVKDLFSIGLNLGKGANNTIIVDGLWAGGPSDKAGIKVGEEIIACNGRPFNAEAIFQLRQLINDGTVKDVKLAVKNEGAP